MAGRQPGILPPRGKDCMDPGGQNPPGLCASGHRPWYSGLMAGKTRIEAGQLRRWRGTTDGDPELFLVLEQHSIPLPGDWTDDGWWVLTDRIQWVAQTDIEDESDLVEFRATPE